MQTSPAKPTEILMSNADYSMYVVTRNVCESAFSAENTGVAPSAPIISRNSVQNWTPRAGAPNFPKIRM